MVTFLLPAKSRWTLKTRGLPEWRKLPVRKFRCAGQSPPAERTAQQFDDVGGFHVAAEGAQELSSPDGALKNAPGKERAVTFGPQAIHHRAGQSWWGQYPST